MLIRFLSPPNLLITPISSSTVTVFTPSFTPMAAIPLLSELDRSKQIISWAGERFAGA